MLLVTDNLDKHCSGQNVCVLSCFDNAFYGMIGSGSRIAFSMTDTIPVWCFLRLCETLPFCMHNELFFLHRLIVSDNK